MALGLMHQAHLHPIAGKGPLHKNHLARDSPHPQPITGEVVHGEALQVAVHPLSLLHRSSSLPRPYRPNCKGALHLRPFPLGCCGWTG